MKHPLTLLAFIVIAVLITYFTVNYDQQIYDSITGLKHPALDAVMIFITNIATLYIGVPIVLAILYFSKKKKAAGDLLLALLIGVAITLVLKSIIAKPRPEDLTTFSFLISATFSSFPSDHASTAFIMFGVIGHYFKKYKLWLYLLAVLIAISRIYLEVHYPSDILAGAFIGILVSQFVMRYRIADRIMRIFKK